MEKIELACNIMCHPYPCSVAVTMYYGKFPDIVAMLEPILYNRYLAIMSWTG